MKVTKVNPKNLDEKIEQICAKDKISISTLQRTFDIGFGAAGYIIDGALEQGLVEDDPNKHLSIVFKILSQDGFKKYLHETLSQPIPKSQFQN